MKSQNILSGFFYVVRRGRKTYFKTFNTMEEEEERGQAEEKARAEEEVDEDLIKMNEDLKRVIDSHLRQV